MPEHEVEAINVNSVVDDHGKTWVYWAGWIYRLDNTATPICLRVDNDDSIKTLIEAGYIKEDPIDKAVDEALDKVDRRSYAEPTAVSAKVIGRITVINIINDMRKKIRKAQNAKNN